MEYYGYIYLTVNTINGHKYIGQHHWEHPGIDSKYYGSGKLLLQAIDKYGKENFCVHVLQWCKNQWDLDSREMAWIRFYDAVHSPEFYNIANGGKAPNSGKYGKESAHYGHPHTKESKQKIREGRLGKYCGENSSWYGRQHTEESKQKMREAQLGKKASEETRKKMSEQRRGENNSFYGHQHTEETKKKNMLAHIKLTETQVLEIVELRGKGFLLKKLAKMFGVCDTTISNICNGKRYSLITRHKIY